MGLIFLILGVMLGGLLLRTAAGPALAWTVVSAGIGIAHNGGWL